jgi:hypothetical protein
MQAVSPKRAATRQVCPVRGLWYVRVVLVKKTHGLVELSLRPAGDALRPNSENATVVGAPRSHEMVTAESDTLP